MTRFLLLLSATGVLAGCGWVFGRESRSGTFSARVTGAVAAALEGRASSGRLPASTGAGYAITLRAADGRAIYLYSASRAAPGSFAIHPFSIEQPAEGYKAVFFAEPNGRAYESTAGTLTITGNGGLAGTFHFEGVERPGGPVAVVDGSFTLR